ncbi:MAG: arylsulfatase A-like enzyme [Planctomycetota bacterium]|jgi:arylsulfatase A-like enzyme
MTIAGELILIAGSLLQTMSVSESSNLPAPPNIVVLVADDLGWEDLSINGSRIKTPRIDSLAASGVTLSQFYVLPQCTPTRAALLTGRYPFHTGLQNWPIQPWSIEGLPLEERTIAEVLGEVGYETALVGKWHLGHAREELLPHRRGFEHSYGCYGDGIDYFTHLRGSSLDWHRNGKDLVEEGYATELFAKEAVRRIKERDPKRRLLLYVPFTTPHSPIQPPEPIDNPRGAYAAMVQSLDDAVGQILDAIESEGISENTLVWFLSDNGRAIKHRDRSDHLRGTKFQPYEGGIRSPTYVVWPGRIPKGSVSDQLLHAVDLMPTLANLARAERPNDAPPLDGIDAWKAITENQTISRKELPLVITPGWCAIRDGEWKLIVRDRNTNPRFELYRVSEDPREQHDLARSRPKVVARLKKRLTHWESQAVPPVQNSKHRPTDWKFPEVIGPPPKK